MPPIWMTLACCCRQGRKGLISLQVDKNIYKFKLKASAENEKILGFFFKLKALTDNKEKASQMPKFVLDRIENITANRENAGK